MISLFRWVERGDHGVICGGRGVVCVCYGGHCVIRCMGRGVIILDGGEKCDAGRGVMVSKRHSTNLLVFVAHCS